MTRTPPRLALAPGLRYADVERALADWDGGRDRPSPGGSTASRYRRAGPEESTRSTTPPTR